MTPDTELTRKLLQIAHAANPPDEEPEPWEFDVVLPSTDGWQVAFFYDCGELDYIDHFISPDGEQIEVWEDDQRFQFPIARAIDGSTWSPLQCWRGVDDTERLLEALK